MSNLFIPLLMVASGIYVRTAGILAGTFAITFDQGRDLLAASDILGGKMTLIGPTTGLAGVFHGPLWYWLLALLSLLAGGDVKIILLLVVLMYAVVEFWLFTIINKYYGFWPALFLLGLISFSPFYIAFMGQLWSPSMALLSTMFVAGSLVAIANGRKLYWLLGLALGAGIQFEAAGGVFLSIAAFATLIFLRPPKANIKDFFVIMASILATLVPQVLFELRHGFQMTRVAFAYFGHKRSDLIAEYGVKSVEYKTGLFFDNLNKIFSPDSIIFTLILILALFCLSLLYFNQKGRFDLKNRLMLVWSTSIVIFMWLIVNFYFDVVWYHFLFGISIFYLMAITVLMTNLKTKFPIAVNLIALSTIIFLLLPIIDSDDLKDYEGDHSVFRNKLAILDEIYGDANNKSFNVVVYEPTTFSYSWDYLFDWHGKKRYGRLPIDNNDQQAIAYYIIEPDSIAGRRVGWIEERIGEGEIVWSKEYWSDNGVEGDGFLLQKRVRTM